MGVCEEYINKIKEEKGEGYPEWAIYKVVYENDIKLCRCGEPALWFVEIYPEEDHEKIQEIWWCDECI